MKELSTIPGLAKAIIGVCRKNGQESYCYSADKFIDILSERMPREQAELFLQQAESTWAGETSPTFLYHK